MASIGDTSDIYNKVVAIEKAITWIEGMVPANETALVNSLNDPVTAKSNITKVTRVTKA